MRQGLNEARQYGNKKRKHGWIILLSVLLLTAIAISSCIVGYILGKRTKQSGGRVIETIFLSPTDPSNTVPFSLSGIVRYSDGEPCSGKTVELHSKLNSSVTDEKGRFFYYDVGQENHVINIFDENGVKLASLELTVCEKLTVAELVQLPEGGYKLCLPVDVLLVELALDLNTETGELCIGDEALCIVRTGGRVSTQYGNADADEAQFVLTPHGNTVLSDGSVNMPGNGVMLNNGTYIASDTTVTFPKGIVTLPEGIEIQSNEKLTFPDGTELSLSGFDILLSDSTRITDTTVTLPDGMTIDNESHVVTASNGVVIDPNTPGVLPDGTTVRTDGTLVTSDGKEIALPNGSGYIVGNDGTRPIETNAVGGRIIVKDDAAVNWIQKTEMNLFNGTGKLYPGVFGSFDFCIKNAQNFDIEFSMRISEAQHEAGAIPFEYRLIRAGEFVAGSGEWISAKSLRAVSVLLATGEESVYTLEWRWPFDSGDDVHDTILGTHRNAEHNVSIIIKAEQVL